MDTLFPFLDLRFIVRNYFRTFIYVTKKHNKIKLQGLYHTMLYKIIINGQFIRIRFE